MISEHGATVMPVQQGEGRWRPGWLHGRGDVWVQYQGTGSLQGREGHSRQKHRAQPACHLTDSTEKILSSLSQSPMTVAQVRQAEDVWRPTSSHLCPALTHREYVCGDGGDWCERGWGSSVGAALSHHLMPRGIVSDGSRDRSKQPVPGVRIDPRRGGCI